MTQNIINIGNYKYLIEYFDAGTDLKNNQYLAEFVMLRNFTILNNIIYDNDIYIIERNHLNEYIDELKKSNVDYGNSLSFPITNLRINSYSNSYKKFNDMYNIYENNINDALFDSNGNISKNVYELYEIKGHKLHAAKIKCDKVKIYHPIVKKNLNLIVDVCNYINGINFHYLCRPINKYEVKTETEIKIDNDRYSEYVELYFPNVEELFKIDEEGNYKIFYKEDFNIVASTRNEKFINSIMSNSSELDHSDIIDGVQVVPVNLLIQPYRIIEEYAADSEFNYNNTVADDEKMFVKLYLKNNTANMNNFSSNNINFILYPYKDIDNHSNIYILSDDLTPGYHHSCGEFNFRLMSRIGFTDGIISIVSLFDYPNKSYFYSKYKDDNTTSPIKEAYKYYNNIDDHYYNLFINEEIEKEINDIDNVTEISDDIVNMVKDVANVTYTDKDEILNVWKKLMKDTILKEYEEEFNTPVNFLGFKIQISSDISFQHIVYERNARVNFNDLDDFAFKLNGIFEGWNQKPEQLLCKISFYDRLLGIELHSNLIIITKEWFKYLINDTNVIYRLNSLSALNKDIDNMNVIDLQENKVNFINTIKCVVHKDEQSSVQINKTHEQKIIFKPIFYKVKDLQNISLRPNISQKIAINLSEYISKINTFKIVIENKEYIEIGRNNIFVIFEINTNDIGNNSGTYNLIDNSGNYISSGNWTIS